MSSSTHYFCSRSRLQLAVPLLIMLFLGAACAGRPAEPISAVSSDAARSAPPTTTALPPAPSPVPTVISTSTAAPALPFCAEASSATFTFDIVDPAGGETIQTNLKGESIVNQAADAAEITLPLDAANLRIQFTGVDDDITGVQLSVANDSKDVEVSRLGTAPSCGEGYFVYQTNEVSVPLTFDSQLSVLFQSTDDLGHVPQEYALKLSAFGDDEAGSFFVPIGDEVAAYGTHGAIMLLGANPVYSDKFEGDAVTAIREYVEQQGQSLSNLSFTIYSATRGQKVEPNIPIEFTDDGQPYLEIGDFAYRQGEALQIGVKNAEPQSEDSTTMIRYPALSWLGGNIDHQDDVGDGFTDTHRAWDLGYSVGTPLFTMSETTDLYHNTNIRGIEGCEGTRGYLPDLAAAFGFGHTGETSPANGDSISRNDFVGPNIQIALVDETQPFPCAGREHVHLNIWTGYSKYDVGHGVYAEDEDHVIDPFAENPFGEEGVVLPYGLWLEETLPEVIKERFHAGFYQRNKHVTYDALLTGP